MGEGPSRTEEEARESRLQQAIADDDVAQVHELIAEERELLDRVSKYPFPNTPLHVATATGKTQVAMEMAILRPTFARELNVGGYSPMHLALQHGNYHTVRALMTIDTNLIRVRGRCGITPLHYVAKTEGDDESELLAEFLYACKSSIEDLTSRCETAVHVAIKNNNLKAFKVLFGWLKRVYLTEILDWKDEDGNTVLHIAESQGQMEIVKLLKRYVKVNAKNFQGKTAREISQVNHDGDEHLAEKSQLSTYILFLTHISWGEYLPNLSLSQFLSREQTVVEKCAIYFGHRNKSAREMILLVSALIASATYQAAFTPPGGYWQDDSSNPLANSSSVAVEKPHEAGSLIMSGSRLYQFMAFNSAVFLASIMTIWMTAITLLPHTIMVYGSTLFVGCAYLTTLLAGFPNSESVGPSLLWKFYLILLGLVVVVPSLLWIKHGTIRSRIDAPWRRIGKIIKLDDE